VTEISSRWDLVGPMRLEVPKTITRIFSPELFAQASINDAQCAYFKTYHIVLNNYAETEIIFRISKCCEIPRKGVLKKCLTD
jgi:hypothetical protein